MTDPLRPALTDKPFGISQIKAYIPITLDMTKMNYQVWRELFETHCTSFGVLGHIDGTTTSTPDDDKTWREHDGFVKTWLYGTISESILETVLKPKCTSRDLWTAIENLFRDNKEARALELESEIRSTVIGDLKVHDYCTKMKTLSDLLTNLESPISERVLVMHLLNGLSEKFDNIINVIKHRNPFPSFLETRSMLTMEEDRLARQLKPVPTETTTSSTPSLLYTATAPPPSPALQHTQPAFQSHGGSYRGNRGGRGYRGRNNRGRGRYNNYWPSMYPPNPWSPQAWMTPSYPPYAAAPYSSGPHQGILGPAPMPPRPEALALPPAASPYTIPPGLAHAFNTMALQDPSDSTWYMDTGATNHIASNSGPTNPPPAPPLQ